MHDVHGHQRAIFQGFQLRSKMSHRSGFRRAGDPSAIAGTRHTIVPVRIRKHDSYSYVPDPARSLPAPWRARGIPLLDLRVSIEDHHLAGSPGIREPAPLSRFHSRATFRKVCFVAPFTPTSLLIGVIARMLQIDPGGDADSDRFAFCLKFERRDSTVRRVQDE